MTEANLLLVRRRLLNWYRKNRRDLPWRRSRDPYAIWISESMLQQTQVKTMLPYYARFLSAFPSVHSLARAPLQRVLRLWSGLGYYRRAENLHKAARQIVRRHGGIVPREYAQLRTLPGIGDYTANWAPQAHENIRFTTRDDFPYCERPAFESFGTQRPLPPGLGL